MADVQIVDLARRSTCEFRSLNCKLPWVPPISFLEDIASLKSFLKDYEWPQKTPWKTMHERPWKTEWPWKTVKDHEWQKKHQWQHCFSEKSHVLSKLLWLQYNPSTSIWLSWTIAHDSWCMSSFQSGNPVVSGRRVVGQICRRLKMWWGLVEFWQQ